MKFTIIFFIISLSVISGFVIHHKITFAVPKNDASVEALPEQLKSGMDILESSDEGTQVEGSILYSCNGKECKNTCWSQFRKAGSCHKNVCRCR